MNNSTTKTLSWLIVLAGIWEVISPWVLGFSNLPSAMINAVITGALLIIYGLVAAFTRSSGLAMVLNWLNALVGLWLIVAPFVMGFAALSYAAEISSIIVGAVAVIFGIWAAVAASRRSRVETMESEHMMGSIPVTGTGTVGSMDGDIQRRVMDRLTQDPRVHGSGIDVLVNNGEVTLRGMVKSSEEKRLAENDAEAVSGVRSVRDDLTTSM
jgi:hypothetical protein